jgi:RNA-directed DNA polymerase
MTSNSDSIDVSLSGIYKSWYAFRSGKRISKSIIAFEYDLENNLDLLAKDLQGNRYHHGGYRYLTVNDSKKRLIAVASVRDRVVHRLLYDYFEPRMDPHFDFDVWSCRKGKGLQGAIERGGTLLRRHPDAWIWRGDIAKFFDCVNHDIALSAVRRFIPDVLAQSILQGVIRSYSVKSKTGIAIGNLTSQILSNVYLNEFDRYIRHVIKPLGYIRYGDDFIMLLPSRAVAQKASVVGTAYLASELKLKVHATSDIIVPAKRGLHFLGVDLFAQGCSIQERTWHRMKIRLSQQNESSYYGLVNSFGSKRQQKEYLWLSFDDDY